MEGLSLGSDVVAVVVLPAGISMTMSLRKPSPERMTFVIFVPRGAAASIKRSSDVVPGSIVFIVISAMYLLFLMSQYLLPLSSSNATYRLPFKGAVPLFSYLNHTLGQMVLSGSAEYVFPQYLSVIVTFVTWTTMSPLLNSLLTGMLTSAAVAGAAISNAAAHNSAMRGKARMRVHIRSRHLSIFLRGPVQINQCAKQVLSPASQP